MGGTVALVAHATMVTGDGLISIYHFTLPFAAIFESSITQQSSIQRYANMSVEPITNTSAEAADQKSAPEIDDKFGRKVRLDRDIS